MATYVTAHNAQTTRGTVAGPYTSTEDTFYVTLMSGSVKVTDDVTGATVFTLASPVDASKGVRGFTFGTGFAFNIETLTSDPTSCGVAV